MILSNCLGSSICSHTIVLGAIRLYLQACLQVNTKRPQDTKEARVMALLSYREVLALPVTLDISHARAIARASADLLKVLQSMKVARFHDTLNK